MYFDINQYGFNLQCWSNFSLFFGKFFGSTFFPKKVENRIPRLPDKLQFICSHIYKKRRFFAKLGVFYDLIAEGDDIFEKLLTVRVSVVIRACSVDILS